MVHINIPLTRCKRFGCKNISYYLSHPIINNPRIDLFSMAANAITFSEKIVIERPKDIVWDYVQDFDRIAEWDQTVIEALVTEEAPKTVKLKLVGNVSLSYVYKLENRPNKLSLSFRKVESSVLEHGGITSTFEERSATTMWIQTYTLVFKRAFLMGLRLPYYRWKFGMRVRKAMKNAKEILENIPLQEEDAAKLAQPEDITTVPNSDNA